MEPESGNPQPEQKDRMSLGREHELGQEAREPLNVWLPCSVGGWGSGESGLCLPAEGQTFSVHKLSAVYYLLPCKGLGVLFYMSLFARP